jgi:hypothetical protein
MLSVAVPGNDVLNRLGEVGVGVVYRARHHFPVATIRTRSRRHRSLTKAPGGDPAEHLAYRLAPVAGLENKSRKRQAATRRGQLGKPAANPSRADGWSQTVREVSFAVSHPRVLRTSAKAEACDSLGDLPGDSGAPGQ